MSSKINNDYCYFKRQDPNSLKSLFLAFMSPFVHPVLSISNICYRLFNIATFQHFRKNHEDGYSFKAKLLDTGKDAAIILAQPFALIALAITAIAGTIFPKQGLKLYFNIENAIYNRPILSQIVNYRPIEEVEEKTKEYSEAGSDDSCDYSTEEKLRLSSPFPSRQNPPPPLDKLSSSTPIPVKKQEKKFSFEEKLQRIIDQENNKTFFSGARLSQNCIELLAAHIIENFPDENFNEWFEQELNLVKQKSNLAAHHFDAGQIYAKVAGKLLDHLFETSDLSIIQRFYKEDQIQIHFLQELDKILENLSLNEPEKFKHQYLLLLNVIHNLPISPIPEKLFIIQEKIIAKYTERFKEMFEQTNFDQNLSDKVKILQELILTIKDPELLDGIIEELLTNELKPCQVLKLINYFSYDESIKQTLLTYNKTSNADPSIAEFGMKVSEILKEVPEEKENHFYLQFFLIHIRNNLEAMSLKIAEKAKDYNWDWSKKIHRQNRDEIQAAIEGINHRFQLNIECVIESKTQYDNLVSLLASVFTQLNTQYIRDWCEEKQAARNLIGFQNWLLNGQLYLSIKELYNPENIDELYTIFLS